MEEHLLDILCCPITRRPLKRLSADELERLNAAIASGGVRNQANSIVSEALTDALVTTDSELVYPVRGGIPVLLADECIDWSAFRDLAVARL